MIHNKLSSHHSETYQYISIDQKKIVLAYKTKHYIQLYFCIDYFFLKSHLVILYCVHIRTRGGIHNKIWPKTKGFPEGAAKGKSRGPGPYFTVYPDLSPSTDIIPFLTMIF